MQQWQKLVGGPLMNKLPDRDLVQLAIGGEEMAYTALTNRYRKSLIAYIGKLLSSNKGNEPEVALEPGDICQEAFNKAFLNIRNYNPNYEFSTWLFSIAKNSFIDYMRKRKLTMDAGFGPENETDITNYSTRTDTSPEEKMISTQEYAKLIRHIENLPESYKEIAVMRFIKEFAYQEIANELNLPLNTVKTKVKRAKELLAKNID